MATHADFLERGLMPKEAPTPFGSWGFGALAQTPPAAFRARVRSSELCRHLLARPGLTARPLGVPNPHAFFRLAEDITRSWTAISARLEMATLSVTLPIDDPQGRRAMVPQQ